MKLSNCCKRICTATTSAMLGVSLAVSTHAQAPKHYEATIESLNQHPLPQWYDDAKLGIFVHWGLYSVPGWAPRGGGIDEQVATAGWEGMLANNPYAEWYQNSLRVGDTPTRRYHRATYGPDFSYDDFAPIFRHAAARLDP